MVIREAGTGKVVPGFEHTPTRYVGSDLKLPTQRSINMNAKTKADLKKKAPKEAIKETKPKAVKAPFKCAIMANNGDNVYSKVSQEEFGKQADLASAFKAWLESGDTGEFIAIRRA